MKKMLVVAAVAAVLAVPMMGSAAKVKKCAPACAPACAPVACAPVCAPACPSVCFNPLAPVVGVVQGVGCFIGSTVNGIAGVFTCNPCM